MTVRKCLLNTAILTVSEFKILSCAMFFISGLPFHHIARITFGTLYDQRHDKTNKMSVRPAKPRISLGIRPVWSESCLCAQLVSKDPIFLHADSEDPDQTGRMSRLIWVFAGRIAILLVLSCCGSYNCNILWLCDNGVSLTIPPSW